MYTKKLRKREQAFTQSPQEPSKKKRQPGKYFYLTVIIIIVGAGGKFVFEKIAFNRGIGFLEAEIIYIEASTPGRILNINYAINDTIGSNMPVVVLDKFWISNNPNGQNNNYYANQRRIINTQEEISILRAELSVSNKNIIQLEEGYRKAKNLFFANAIIQSELSKIESKLIGARAEISKQKIELSAARKRLASYRNQQNSLYGTTANLENNSGIYQLYSTKMGIVSQIFKNKGEVVKMGERIVKLLNPESEIIRTYFLAGTENKISTGDAASIYFQNGDRVEGTVSKIYSSTAKQPPEIKNKFGKVQRFIIVEIKPAHPLRTRVFETQVEVFITQKWLQRLRDLI